MMNAFRFQTVPTMVVEFGAARRLGRAHGTLGLPDGIAGARLQGAQPRRGAARGCR